MHLGILAADIENGRHWPWPSRSFGHFDSQNGLQHHSCTPKGCFTSQTCSCIISQEVFVLSFSVWVVCLCLNSSRSLVVMMAWWLIWHWAPVYVIAGKNVTAKHSIEILSKYKCFIQVDVCCVETIWGLEYMNTKYHDTPGLKHIEATLNLVHFSVREISDLIKVFVKYF